MLCVCVGGGILHAQDSNLYMPPNTQVVSPSYSSVSLLAFLKSKLIKLKKKSIGLLENKCFFLILALYNGLQTNEYLKFIFLH